MESSTNAERLTQRFWVSWIQPTEDYRPLNYPPNELVLGWWCSGTDATFTPILCAVVVGHGQTPKQQKQSAIDAILSDWPEAPHAVENWRFFETRESNWIPGVRFSLSDWMESRFKLNSEDLKDASSN